MVSGGDEEQYFILLLILFPAASIRKVAQIVHLNDHRHVIAAFEDFYNRQFLNVDSFHSFDIFKYNVLAIFG